MLLRFRTEQSEKCYSLWICETQWVFSRKNEQIRSQESNWLETNLSEHEIQCDLIDSMFVTDNSGF